MKKTFTTVCPFCHHATYITVNLKDWEDWRNGKLIQDAFPYLTADEREMLKTGICPDCWEKIFN